MTGAALVVQGDALHLPLPDGSIDLIVTSPPYWALRSYSAGPGELGSEPTPAEYLEALWAATAEMMRVLKPTGSAFVDLGDKYSGGAGGGGNLAEWSTMMGTGTSGADYRRLPSKPVRGMPPKSLLLLPERYRVGCVDRLGLIARAVIVWNKPNGLPESVTDRVRRSHEDWVHIRKEAPEEPCPPDVMESVLEAVAAGDMSTQDAAAVLSGELAPVEAFAHLVKQPRYYSATDEVREPHAPASLSRYQYSNGQHQGSWGDHSQDETQGNHRKTNPLGNSLGKLPGSVWTIPSEPLRLPDHLGVQHYAAFPSEWPRRLILGWSPPGICLECGQGRVPVVEGGRLSEEGERLLDGRDSRKRYPAAAGRKDQETLARSSGLSGDEARRYRVPATILGYACSCTPFTDHPGTGEPSGPDGRYGDAIAVGAPYNPGGGLMNRPKVGPWREYHLDGWKPPPTRPAVILDPFGGTGTVAMVARALDRIGISLDLSFPYGRAARWRVRHDAGKAISRTNLERQGQLL